MGERRKSPCAPWVFDPRFPGSARMLALIIALPILGREGKEGEGKGREVLVAWL